MESPHPEYRRQYCSFLAQCERTGMRMSDTLAERLTAVEHDYGGQANDSWLADMQELGEAMLKFPDTILSATPPPDLALLYELYQQWASQYAQLAQCVLDIVSSVRANDLAAYSRAKSALGISSAVVAALTQARSTCVLHFTDGEQA